MMFEDGSVICSECKETGGKMKLQEVEIVKLDEFKYVNRPTREQAKLEVTELKMLNFNWE